MTIRSLAIEINQEFVRIFAYLSVPELPKFIDVGSGPNASDADTVARGLEKIRDNLRRIREKSK
jgi:hypothetical protein